VYKKSTNKFFRFRFHVFILRFEKPCFSDRWAEKIFIALFARLKNFFNPVSWAEKCVILLLSAHFNNQNRDDTARCVFNREQNRL
jgi:hypothetical protein